jgi:hypothetical protein
MTNRTPDIGMFCADRNVEMDSVNYGPLSYSAYSQLQRIENRLFFVLAEAERYIAGFILPITLKAIMVSLS